MRLKLTLAYDGRPFKGWQSQPECETVQDHLLAALAAVAKQPLACQGAGRTDAGVHALGQTAHFDAPHGLAMNPRNWVPALNTHLPATIRVIDCDEVAPDFHARFSASGKTYHYDICVEPVLPPHLAGMAWHQPRGLDPGLLAEALTEFTGTHCFHGFSAYRGNETPETSYRRTIHSAVVETLPNGYRLVFTGDGFLYKMVRLLTGAAIRAAQGRISPAECASWLDQPPGLPRGKCNHCAPPDGLYLREVLYSFLAGGGGEAGEAGRFSR